MLRIFDDPADRQEAPVREGAGFWIRALARVLDTMAHLAVGVIVGLVAAIAVAIGDALQGVGPDPSMATLSPSTPLALVAGIVGHLSMHTVCEGFHGSTLGKRICGLTVVSEDGGPATPLGALKRSIAYLWDAIFFGWVGSRKMAESPRRQRFGDIWGHTQVVHLSALDASERRSWVRFGLAAAVGLAVDVLVLLVELATRLA